MTDAPFPFAEWVPEMSDPEWMPERALQFSKEVGPDAVLSKLAWLTMRNEIEGWLYHRVRSLLKPGPHEIADTRGLI